ncbi:MAG: Peptidoglycan glycosyltransferase MrdB [Anaerolineales bacterium]|nr:Peptidoglycan glycosyltransferase MrdB [Anaerolineales bacterium]
MFRETSWRRFDFWLLGVLIFAISFGVAMIRSAIAGNEELAQTVLRQVQFGVAGLIVIFIVAGIDYRYWTALYTPMFVVMMILLIMIYISAQPQFGAARWFQIAGIFIQPTELAKVVEVLILARYFDATKDRPRDLRWIFGSLVWVGTLALPILLQPNLSNVVVMLVIWAAMIWINGIQLKHIFWFGVAGLTIVIVAFPFLEPYQQERVLTFIFPDENATFGNLYNVQQALIAIGSGGWFGRGYGLGTQSQLRFLKVRHTDFIFSVIAEEFGLVGALLALSTIVFIVYRCLRASRLARDLSGSLIAYGIAVLIFFQGAINIGVNLRIVPVSGLPLPFISYGGSGLVSLMLGIALVESVVMRQKEVDF